MAKNKVPCPNYLKVVKGKRVCDNYLGMTRIYVRKQTADTEFKQRYLGLGWTCEKCGFLIKDSDLEKSKKSVRDTRRKKRKSWQGCPREAKKARLSAASGSLSGHFAKACLTLL